MGLNLPARQVVLYDLQRFDGRDFVAAVGQYRVAKSRSRRASRPRHAGRSGAARTDVGQDGAPVRGRAI